MNDNTQLVSMALKKEVSKVLFLNKQVPRVTTSREVRKMIINLDIPMVYKQV